MLEHLTAIVTLAGTFNLVKRITKQLNTSTYYKAAIG